MIGYIHCRGCGQALRVSDNWLVVRCGVCTVNTRIKPDMVFGQRTGREDDDEDSGVEQR